MNLYRIRLNQLKKSTVRAFSNPNLFHGAIERSIQDKRERVLWRIDKLQGNIYLLMLSNQELETSHLVNQFGYPEEKAQVADYNRLLDKIQNGSQWIFRLCANPVNRTAANLDQRGKVLAHTSEKHQLEWLEHQGKRHGFTVDLKKTSVRSIRWVSFKKTSSNNPVSFKEAAFEGVLTVTDSTLFRNALINGIGREKAYGMGLMTIIPYHG